MTKAKQTPQFPDRKISETFLHFADPLLEPLETHATEEKVIQALQVAFTVWNSVVYEATQGDKHYMTMLQDLTGGQPGGKKGTGAFPPAICIKQAAYPYRIR